MSSFILKIIAIVTMIIDHTRFLGVNNFVSNYFGKLSFPIYAFLIAQGYIHTKNFSKYLLRLSIFALISQIPAYLLFKPYLQGQLYLNIFFTLAFGLLAIRLYDKIKDKYIKILAVFIIAFIAEILHTDYGAFGVLLITSFYVFKDKKAINVLVATALILFHQLSKVPSFDVTHIKLIRMYLLAAIFNTIALLPISLYNNKLGPSNKYLKILFYLVYPVHLLAFYFINLIIN